MKIILENWRRYLHGNFLNEAAKGVVDLGEYKVYIERSPDYIEIAIGTDENYAEVGNIALEIVEGCKSGNKVWYVSDVNAHIEGFGPFLYDLAIIYSTKHGFGLTSDKSQSTSMEALNLWKYYIDNRSGEYDIKSIFSRCPDSESPRMRGAELVGGSKHLTPDDEEFKYLTSVLQAKSYQRLRDLMDLNKIVRL